MAKIFSFCVYCIVVYTYNRARAHTYASICVDMPKGDDDFSSVFFFFFVFKIKVYIYAFEGIFSLSRVQIKAKKNVETICLCFMPKDLWLNIMI